MTVEIVDGEVLTVTRRTVGVTRNGHPVVLRPGDELVADGRVFDGRVRAILPCEGQQVGNRAGTVLLVDVASVAVVAAVQ